MVDSLSSLGRDRSRSLAMAATRARGRGFDAGGRIYLFHPEIIKNIGISSKDFVNPGVLHAEKLVNMSKHN